MGAFPSNEHNDVTSISPSGTITIELGSNGSSAPVVDVGGTAGLSTLQIPVGAIVVLRFTDVMTLTNSTSLVLPGGADITTASGDMAIFVGYENGIARCASYMRASGAELSTFDSLVAHGADIASASTINLNSATGAYVDVTGTTTITAITLSDGNIRWVRFTGALTLTHGSSLVLPGAANITTVAGDWALFAGFGSGVVRCIGYWPVTVTGTGAAVRATSPTLTTAVLGSSTCTTQAANDNSTKLASTAYADRVYLNQAEVIGPIRVTSDETTDVTTGASKISFRMPFAMTVTSVRGSLASAATGATKFEFDVLEGGVSIFSTRPTFDASELTTTTAATPAVISDSALADDALVSVDVIAVGNTLAGKGFKLWLIGTRA